MRQTVYRWSSLCTVEALEPSLIQMTVPDGPVRALQAGPVRVCS